MRTRLLAIASTVLACACSSAPPEVHPPERQPAPSATAKARPPRELKGAPVMLARRTPTPARGVEWAWLMPEGRLVTLAPPNAEGERAMFGPNFFAGPNGLFLGLDVSGDLTLAADGKARLLGKYELATFDAKGERALVWNSAGWSLVGRDGVSRVSDLMTSTWPSLLPDGTVVAMLHYPATRIHAPDGVIVQTILHECAQIFPVSRRLVCSDPPSSADRKRSLIHYVFSPERAGELARFSLEHRGGGRPAFAVRADGGEIAIGTDRIEILDLTPGKGASPRTVYRRATRLSWAAPRMAYTADGKRLCVEESDVTQVLDPSAGELTNGAAARQASASTPRSACTFAPRGADPSGPGWKGPTTEWEGVMVTLPAPDGFDRVRRYASSHGYFETIAVSADRKTAALEEQKGQDEGGGQRTWTEQVVIFDAATGAVRRTVPLGSHTGRGSYEMSELTLELSDDGESVRVCHAELFQELCRAYSTATGETLAPTAWRGRHPNGMTVWSGDLPEVKLGDVLATMSVPVEGKAKVTSWSDEGAYLSIELDLGDGSSMHLNLPDTPDHVARDVQALAGGALFAVTAHGMVELRRTQPHELVAALVGVEGGAAAMFPDGSVEIAGKGAEALGCQQEERIVPIDRCGDVWAEPGTLLAKMRSVKQGR